MGKAFQNIGTLNTFNAQQGDIKIDKYKTEKFGKFECVLEHNTLLASL